MTAVDRTPRKTVAKTDSLPLASQQAGTALHVALPLAVPAKPVGWPASTGIANAQLAPPLRELCWLVVVRSASFATPMTVAVGTSPTEKPERFEFRIGSDPQNDHLYLPDSGVRPAHAVLRLVRRKPHEPPSLHIAPTDPSNYLALENEPRRGFFRFKRSKPQSLPWPQYLEDGVHIWLAPGTELVFALLQLSSQLAAGKDGVGP